MQPNLPPGYQLSPEVAQAIAYGQPVVALESAVITHGLPHPQNLQLAKDTETEARRRGAIPATIAVIDGEIKIGLDLEQLERLAAPSEELRKISRRDLGIAHALRLSGGATVAATLIAARTAGLRVLATGGIEGVHRRPPYDISADLPELGRSPLAVVCCGAKAVLDLPATTQVLETLGVPIIGYQTNEFPAFYGRSSGLPVDSVAHTPQEAVQIIRSHWSLGLNSAVLIVALPPAEFALPPDIMEMAIDQALLEADRQRISGPAVTPFLLKQVAEITGSASLEANLALLRQNAGLAAEIAKEIYTPASIGRI